MILSNTPEKLIVRIPANESIANALRRSMTEIEILAVDEVEIFKNDSALYDEMVAHRIGLVPLKTEKSMNSKTKVEFKLSVEGPRTVYSGDLQGAGEVVLDKIPITTLGEGHKLELVATATLGKGVQHAKHTPGLCYYRHIWEIKSTPEIDKIVQASKGALKPEKKGSKWIADISDQSITEIEAHDKAALTQSDEMILIVESYGALAAKDLLIKSVEALSDNLDEVEKVFK